MSSLFTSKKQAIKIQKIAGPILFWQLVESLSFLPLILSFVTINYHNKILLVFLMIINIPIGYLEYRIAKTTQTYAPFGLPLGLSSYKVGKRAANEAKINIIGGILFILFVQILLYIKYT